MAKQTLEPGPGRSTSDTAFKELITDVAQKNERAHKEARLLRAERDRKRVIWRGKNNLDY